MGCDIHFFVEYKVPGGKGWKADKNHKPYDADAYIDRNGEFIPGDEDYQRVGDLPSSYKTHEHKGKEYVLHDYDSSLSVGRNYRFFGFLADVRSSQGTAIYDPRGMPKDCSEEIQKACDDWYGDGHSHSYLSLDEFINVVEQYRESERKECEDNKEETKWVDTCYNNIIDYIKEQREKLSYECDQGLFDTKADARVVFWFDN